MIILITLAALTFGGFYLSEKVGYDWEIFCNICGVFSGIFLFIALITIPINRMGVHSGILEIQATRIAFDESRSRADNVERYTRLDNIIKVNQELASCKYYNTTVFDIWIPDEIEYVNPIK